jgi:hypothetical protein
MLARLTALSMVVSIGCSHASALGDAGADRDTITDARESIDTPAPACKGEIALTAIMWVRDATTGSLICDPTFRFVAPHEAGDVGDADAKVGSSCAQNSTACPMTLPDGDTFACTFAIGDPEPTLAAVFTVEVFAPGYAARIVPGNFGGYDGRGCGLGYQAPSMIAITLTPLPPDAAADAP